MGATTGGRGAGPPTSKKWLRPWPDLCLNCNHHLSFACVLLQLQSMDRSSHCRYASPWRQHHSQQVLADTEITQSCRCESRSRQASTNRFARDVDATHNDRIAKHHSIHTHYMSAVYNHRLILLITAHIWPVSCNHPLHTHLLRFLPSTVSQPVNDVKKRYHWVYYSFIQQPGPHS